ncbi:C40 family peptidase [Streptomyces griseoluteus]|uniref:C40 family peptidase n=1 Tax=Streptomyces griseoluteus TaxID=29306 RepID=UPI0036B8A81A
MQCRNRPLALLRALPPSLYLPRTAAAQYRATSNHAVSREDLKVGDLLFKGRGGSVSICHVAMYGGDGNVINAPCTGRNVSIVPDLSHVGQ